MGVTLGRVNHYADESYHLIHFWSGYADERIFVLLQVFLEFFDEFVKKPFKFNAVQKLK